MSDSKVPLALQRIRSIMGREKHPLMAHKTLLFELTDDRFGFNCLPRVSCCWNYWDRFVMNDANFNSAGITMTYRTKIILAAAIIALNVGAYLYFSRDGLKVSCPPGVKLAITTDANGWTEYRCGSWQTR